LAGPKADAAEAKIQWLQRPKSNSPQYFPAVASAVQASKGEGATFQSFDDIMNQVLADYRDAEDTKSIGEYLMLYEVSLGKTMLAKGVQSFYISPPLDVEATPYFLKANKLGVIAKTEFNEAKTVRLKVQPGELSSEVPFANRRATTTFDTSNLAAGNYKLFAEALDAENKLLAKTDAQFIKPSPPDWWTMDLGKEPVVPEPWTPI